MPLTSRASRESSRLRQQRFRQRRKVSGLVESRAPLPHAMSRDLDVLAAFQPGRTKERMLATAIKAYLDSAGAADLKVAKLITTYYLDIEAYKSRGASLVAPGQFVRVKDRVFTFEESQKMKAIKEAIVAHLKVRGLPYSDPALRELFERLYPFR